MNSFNKTEKKEEEEEEGGWGQRKGIVPFSEGVKENTLH